MSLLYQYTFSEGTVNQVVYGTIDSPYPNPATAPAFCTITGSKPSGNVTAGGTETATFNATWDGPLEYSSDLANAKWYLMTLGYQDGHKQVFRYSALNTTINLPTDAYTFTYSSKDQFAFVGNPLDGFQVINRSENNPRLVANADGTGNPTFANSPSSAQSDRWDIYNVTVGPASSIIPSQFLGKRDSASTCMETVQKNSTEMVEMLKTLYTGAVTTTAVPSP